MGHLSGWQKDKYDRKDYLSDTSRKAGLIDYVDLSGKLSGPRYQGRVNACVGFSLSTNLEYAVWAENKLPACYSPTWIYNGARFMEGKLAEDVGSRPKDALEWLRNSGCLEERYWPFNPDKVDTASPSSERMSLAEKYPGFAYYRVANGIYGLMSALADGHCISIGTPWPGRWLDSKDGKLPMITPDEDMAGGHEYILYGYDRMKSVFYGQNSWGTEWGKQGRFEMPFSAVEVFKQRGGYDAHYVVLNAKRSNVFTVLWEAIRIIVRRGR